MKDEREKSGRKTEEEVKDSEDRKKVNEKMRKARNRGERNKKKVRLLIRWDATGK